MHHLQNIMKDAIIELKNYRDVREYVYLIYKK